MQFVRGAPVAEELAHPLGEYGEAGFEVVAALVDMHVAGATEEDLQSLLYFSRSHLVEGNEAHITIRLEHLLQGGLGAVALVLNVTFHINYKISGIYKLHLFSFRCNKC